VIHVLDASRAVVVCSNLLDKSAARDEYVQEVIEDYEEIRQDHYAGLEDKRMVDFETAKANKMKIDFSKMACAPVKGNGVFEIEYATKDLIQYIDWVPFFSVFELHGRYPNRGFPNIFKDEHVGPEAKKLYDEALQMLDEIIQGEIPLQAKAVIGIFPANSTGEDVLVYKTKQVEKLGKSWRSTVCFDSKLKRNLMRNRIAV